MNRATEIVFMAILVRVGMWKVVQVEVQGYSKVKGQSHVLLQVPECLDFGLDPSERAQVHELRVQQEVLMRYLGSLKRFIVVVFLVKGLSVGLEPTIP